MPEVVYEPRAFWSVQRVTSIVGVETVVEFDREHFRNGTRHPITLDKICFAPVGYLLEEYAGANSPPLTNADRHDCAAALQRMKFVILAPQRQVYALDPLLSSAWSPMPTADISMRDDPSFGYASGMLGVTRWNFDKPVQLPKSYAIDFALGGCLAEPSDYPALGAEIVPTIAFFEEGGIMKGNARSVRGQHGSFFKPNPLALGQAGAFPFPPDGLGVGGPNPANTFTWNTPFSPTEYRRQAQTQAGSDILRGFAVHLEQRKYEDEVQNSAVTNVAGSPVASVALRTPTRCRVHPDTGGSGEDWWREGAPLALVTPTITPAQVYCLHRPITLHPGDILEVEMTVPAGIVAPSCLQINITPTYQMGISFTGYAAIEG